MDLVTEALKTDPSDPNYPKIFVYGNMFKAMALQQLDRCEEAIEAYELVVPKLPKLDGSFLMNKGQAHQKVKQFDKALECYEKIPADD